MQRVTTLPDLPRRPADSHKGTFGRVLVVAGSHGMAGAAMLTARAALRAGAGLVTLLVPEAISTAVAVGVPEATQRVLPGRLDRDLEALSAALDDIDATAYEALAVGPGLGTGPRARQLVGWALSNAVPQVVDADALNVVSLSSDESPLDIAPSTRRVWTPHPGEFRRLMSVSPRTDDQRREAAEAFVTRFGGVLALKGHRTVVQDAQSFAINETGNPGMATGGSGDVLTGIIAALLGQGLTAFDAARLGVHLHGRAGDLARDELGEVSLIAGDLIEALPRAVVEHQRKCAP